MAATCIRAHVYVNNTSCLWCSMTSKKAKRRKKKGANTHVTECCFCWISMKILTNCWLGFIHLGVNVLYRYWVRSLTASTSLQQDGTQHSPNTCAIVEKPILHFNSPDVSKKGGVNLFFAPRCQQIWNTGPLGSGTGPVWGHRSADLSHSHLGVLCPPHKQSTGTTHFQKMWLLILRLGVLRKKWLIGALTPPSPYSATTTTLSLCFLTCPKCLPGAVFLVPSFFSVTFPLPSISSVCFTCQM